MLHVDHVLEKVGSTDPLDPVAPGLRAVRLIHR